MTLHFLRLKELTMRVDTLDAVETFETLGQAVKEAGIGKYNGFLLVEALREKGFRLVLERLPEQTASPAVLIADQARDAAE